nr:unnamed protein product [Callosobruchus analis]
MARNTENCSHVGAVLFAAEYAHRVCGNISCTDVRATWPQPSTVGATVAPASEMNFGRSSSSSSQKMNKVPALTTSEIVELLGRVKDLGYSSALMRVVEPFATEIVSNMVVDLPSVLNIFSEDYVDKDLPY